MAYVLYADRLSLTHVEIEPRTWFSDVDFQVLSVLYVAYSPKVRMRQER